MIDKEINPDRRDRVFGELSDSVTEILGSREFGAALEERLSRLAAELAEASPDIEHDLPARYMIGMLHWLRYQARPGEPGMQDFELAAQWLGPVLANAPDGTIPESVRLMLTDRDTADLVAQHHRAVDLVASYRRTGSLPMLRQAIALYRPVAAAADRLDDTNRAWALANLGAALQMLFEQNGDIDTLREAIQFTRDAIATIAADHPNRAMHLYNLGLELRILFEQNGDVGSLREAIEISRDAIATIAADHPDHGTFVSGLVAALIRLFEQTGELAPLREAVRAGRDSVTVTSLDHPDRADHLTNLGFALFKLFEQTGELALLREAVRVNRDAVSMALPGHPNRVVYLTNLGGALFRLFEQTGELGVLREAVRAGRDAAASATPGRSDLGLVLSNLGTSLMKLFEQTGDLAVLREAVQAERDAVTATPPDHHYLARHLCGLGNTLRVLFLWTGELSVLREAVQAERDAVSAATPDDPDRGMFLSGLGSALLSLFGRAGEPAVLLEAIETERDAVTATPPDHFNYPRYLSDLANTLRVLFEETGDLSVLRDAVRAGREAAAATTADHHDRGLFLANLGGALLRLFEWTGELEVLREAVRASRDGVAATPPDHPNRARYLTVHSGTLRALFQENGEPEVLREARRSCGTASGMVNAHPVDRIVAAQQAASLDLLAGDHDRAIAMVESAVELLPLLTSRELGRADREHQIGRVAGLAPIAAAVAIAAGSPNRAVELLEQTRGLVFAGTLDTRGDISELRDRAPDLADELDELRGKLDAADHEPSLLAYAEQPGAARYRERAARRAQLNQEWHELLVRIRQAADLAGFLRPPPIDELRRHAADGPIVYVTMHDRQGHALVVTDDPDHPVRVIDLPALTEQSTAERADVFRSTRRGADEQQRMLDVLGWIWDTVTEPVLRHLDRTDPPPKEGPWPRIWWCPVGLASYLPLHAAGRHTPAPPTDTVMDRVISSYTPTIRALAHSRTRRPAPATKADSMVIIAVPDAPESSTLDGVAREARLVHDLVPTATVLPPAGATTTRADVTAALRRHGIAHFACHAVADWANPAASHLLLHDHLTHPLTLHHITHLRLEHAQLAYLSACSTTDTNPSQADEATHLTAAFQLAGYRNVIGTLWPIHDRTATSIARDIYRHLTQHATEPPDPTLAAHALHHTIRQRRDRHPTLPTLWAAHTHTGA